MTFDLHLSDDQKPIEFENWVIKIKTVSSILNISYEYLWQIPEIEFDILEREAQKEIDKRKEKEEERKKLLMNKGAGR